MHNISRKTNQSLKSINLYTFLFFFIYNDVHTCVTVYKNKSVYIILVIQQSNIKFIT